MLPQDALETADYPGLVKKSLRTMFPDAKGRTNKRMLYKLVSTGASFQMRDMVLKNPRTYRPTGRGMGAGR
jgi:phosphate transport system permease protein